MRVAIAEDSGFFREALASSLISLDIEVTATVDNADKLLDAVAVDTPDAVIVDICLPPTKTDEGLVVAKELGSMYPSLGILVLSAYLAMPHITRLLGSGRPGMGCMSKDQLHDATVLITALERICAGGTYIDPDFVDEQFRSPRPGTNPLTERELSTLRLVAEGLSNQRLASELSVSVKTVESTLTSVFRKLGVDSKDSNARVSAVLMFLSRPQSFIRLQG